MASVLSRIGRVFLAAPFAALVLICVKEMDVDKLIKFEEQVMKVDKGVIKWPGGSLKVFETFYGIEPLDHMWRAASITFAPSSLGYDEIGWWQMMSFLTDLGPMYAVWYLEAARIGNAWSPAYFATLWTFGAQRLGIGTVAPFVYFLSLVFGPTTADIAGSDNFLRTVQTKWVGLLLPLMLVLHNLEVFAAYLSPDLVARHYWIFAWQMSPLWIGIANFVGTLLAGNLFARFPLAQPRLLLTVLCTISAAVWIATLVLAPYSPAELFLPSWETQEDLTLHSRRALQVDQVCAFSACFLWLLCQFVDLCRLGFAGADAFFAAALLPIALACFGPGVAFVVGWCWRERKLAQTRGRNSS